MLDLIHDVQTPDFQSLTESREKQAKAEPKTDDDWDTLVFTSSLDLMNETKQCFANDHTDLVQRYVSWTRIQCYAQAREILEKGLGVEHAREALMFLIKQEQR